MDIREFQYDLPANLIAQKPLAKRDRSKLMVLDRRTGRITHSVFGNIVREVRPGDALLVNNTRVIKARILGRKESGGKVEALLTKRMQWVSGEEEIWSCLIRSSKRLRPGTVLHFDKDLVGESLASTQGLSTIRFRSRGDFRDVLERVGRIPLPLYIKRGEKEDLQEDRERYQTIFAEEDGAVAAPTAGLHFTPILISKIQSAGVSILYLTLHVGPGTFLPVRTPKIEEHRMHGEVFSIPPKTAEAINSVKRKGGRIIAVGTTVTRAVESSVDAYGQVVSRHGETDLFIYPPFRFRVVDALVTNFHLPGSTLLMLVSAFGGKDLILRAYGEAKDRAYRFYSYGDAMMIV